jgi:hypothetical protein
MRPHVIHLLLAVAVFAYRSDEDGADHETSKAARAPDRKGLPDPKLYPQVPLFDLLVKDRWIRPRALVTGKVMKVTKEKDGDHHVWVSDGKNELACEIVPELPLPRPKVGDVIDVWGVYRWDGEHNWGEIHPCVGWQLAK